MHRSTVVRRCAALLTATALALGGIAAATSPASASDGVAFDWSGAAAIPDSPSACNPGTALDLPITVSGIPAGAALSDVRIANFRLTHSYAGDLTVTLIAPDTTTQVIIFGRTGRTADNPGADSSNLEGPYRFTDRAPGSSWWSAAETVGSTAAVPAGYYRASTVGTTSDTGGAGVSITGAFAGLANANGTWTLRVVDNCHSDVGEVTQASLQLEIASQRCNSANAAVADAQAAYAAAEGPVTSAYDSTLEAQSVLSDAQTVRTARQAAVTAAKATAATATTAAQQARDAREAAADVAITAGATATAATAGLAKADAAVAKAAAAVAKAKGAKKKAAAKALKKAKAAQKKAAAAVKVAAAAVTKAKADLTAARQVATAADQAREVAAGALADARDGFDAANEDVADARQAADAADDALALAQYQLDAALTAVGHAQDDLVDCTQE